MERHSILDYFLANAAAFGDRTAALVREAGRFHAVTWRELGERASRIAAGLIAHGLHPHDRVCLAAETSLSWFLCDMGILAAGGVTVPLYPNNLPDEWQYIAEHAGARVVVAQGPEQSRKLRAERSRLPDVLLVVQLEGDVPPGDGWVVSLEDLCLRGDSVPRAEIDERVAGLCCDDPCTIIYTSGTTGRPKGAVLTHAALMYEADAIAQIHLVDEADVQLLFLPLAHSFARALVIGWLSTRHVMAFTNGHTTLAEDLQLVRPTVMAGVPRTYERLYATVVRRMSAAMGPAARVLGLALDLSRRVGEAELRGTTPRLADEAQLRILRRTLFRRAGALLGEALGGNIRMMISGGAPLPVQVAWFFRDCGIELLEGYGLTETCAATTVTRPGRNRIGTVGWPLPGTLMRLADDGEVLVRGPGVMKEYWREPDATADALRDGWFHSGDVGTFDAAGALRIVDRKKDIIVTAGGKNISPQNIESLLKSHRLISQAVVHGDRRSFLTALVTLDPEGLKSFAQQEGLGDRSYAALTKQPEVRRAIQQAIDRFNEQLPSHENIRKFRILEHDFSLESGELTPSLKVKRKVVDERYRAIFDAFYEAPH